MAGPHPHLQDQLTANTEGHNETNNYSEKKQEDVPNSDVTYPKCFKLFFNKKNVKKIYENRALWTSETQLFGL